MRILGNFWKNMQSLILSHVANEAQVFVSKNITTDAQFSTLLNQYFPNSTAVNQAISSRYPSIAQNSVPPTPTFATNIPPPYKNESDRERAFLQDNSFTCNVRFLTDAYAGKTFNLQYSRSGGLHGSDLIADFFGTGNPSSMAALRMDPTLATLAPGFQSLLISHAVSGDPSRSLPGFRAKLYDAMANGSEQCGCRHAG